MGKILKPYRGMAQFYDIIYKGKATSEDVAFLSWAFRRLARRKIQKVLDVACGTGRLAIPLSAKHSVVGTDISPDMLRMARDKKGSERVKWLRQDMRRMSFRNSFDALICMFTAFNYMLSDEDVRRTLNNFYKALRPGGVAVLDLNNTINYLDTFKPVIVMNFIKGNVRVRRKVAHLIDDSMGAVWTHYEMTKINGRMFREVHRLRIFTSNELRHYMLETGFRKVFLFGDFKDRRQRLKGRGSRLIFVAVK